MASANEEFFDASLRHAVGVRRFTAGEVRRILELLARADVDLVAKIRKQLRPMIGKSVSVRSKRFRDLIRDISVLRGELLKRLLTEFRGSMFDFAKAEAEMENRLITGSIPIHVELATVEAAVLRAAVVSRPFSGGANAARTLQQWFKDLARVDQSRLIGAIQMSMLQGESIDEAVRRVAGTRAMGWRDGVLAITRRNAEAIVRTAINHISNAAREAVWDANAELIDGLQWVSTLDGRTTKICMSRDGKVAPIGGKPIPKNTSPLIPSTARPPAHVRCRSLMIAIFAANGIALAIGDRPFVRDTRTRKKRRRDFRAEAKSAMGDRWGRMSRGQRDAAVRGIKLDWATRVVGRVPAKVTYQQWLTKQSKSFQIEVLGPARAKLFRDGGLTLDEFVDLRGNELTLVQLMKTHPEAFIKAGI